MKFKIDELEELYNKYSFAPADVHTMNSIMMELRQLEEKYDCRFTITPLRGDFGKDLVFQMSFKTPADRNWFALKWGVSE
jgi:hypothetical protein